VEIWTLASGNRQGVVALADVKSKQPAGVYVNWFTWQPPLFDGRIRAFHCVDISFWFLQHGPDADPHRRRSPSASGIGQNGGRLASVYEDR
jgi:carboxylesterase type B